MLTVNLDLDEDALARLKTMSEKRGMTAEALAAEVVSSFIEAEFALGVRWDPEDVKIKPGNMDDYVEP